MAGEEVVPGAAARTVIGGRHGSPSVTVAFPFSKIEHVDSELRDVVEELATLVARLAAATNDDDRRSVADAAHDVIERLGPVSRPSG